MMTTFPFLWFDVAVSVRQLVQSVAPIDDRSYCARLDQLNEEAQVPMCLERAVTSLQRTPAPRGSVSLYVPEAREGIKVHRQDQASGIRRSAADSTYTILVLLSVVQVATTGHPLRVLQMEWVENSVRDVHQLIIS